MGEDLSSMPVMSSLNAAQRIRVAWTDFFEDKSSPTKALLPPSLYIEMLRTTVSVPPRLPPVSLKTGTFKDS